PQTEQQEPQPPQAGAANQFELMRSLNLTPEQRAQIARIRQETEEQARQINQRLRRARRALDEAIYANADESVVGARTRDVADAEAARVKMRADAELKLRRVLTPEQMATFREMRRQALLRQRQLNGSDAGEPRGAGRQTPRQQPTPAQRKADDALRPPLTPRQQRQITRGRRPPRP
ncbi:MAG: Spy/CpxP family protein refolding chaperone, partial [Pyrinomonadaceae bacterium]